MTEKEYLCQYRIACKRVEMIRSEYEAQRSAIDTIRSSLEWNGGQKLEISRPVERMVMLLSEKAEELKEEEAEALRIRQEVLDAILTVPDVGGIVLYERFICLKTWGEVADAVGYSRRQVYRYYEDGLRFLAGK